MAAAALRCALTAAGVRAASTVSFRTCRVSVQKAEEGGAPAPTRVIMKLTRVTSAQSPWAKQVTWPQPNGQGDRKHGPPGNARGLCCNPPNTPAPSFLHRDHTPRPVQHGLQLRARDLWGRAVATVWTAPLTPEPRELKQWVIDPLHTHTRDTGIRQQQ